MSLPPLIGLLALLQDGAAGTAPEGGLMQMLPLFAGMFLILWFVVIRPERKERKRREGMINELRKNDRVLLTGGLFATVAAVGETELTIKFDDGPTRVKVVRSAIASVLDKNGDGADGKS